MDHLIGSIIAFFAAAFFVIAFTPWFTRLAIRIGAVDYPDGHRKNQAQPVPRGGGIVVALAAALAILFVISLGFPTDSSSSAWLMRGLLPAAGILLIVGVIDDVSSITGIYKLVGQVLAVSALVAAGAQFDSISLFGMSFPLGSFRIPFTIFFCLGAINAFNLIDGVDALASSLGAIVSATLGIIALSQGHVAGSLVCFALAGGLVGFLRYNIAPAKVYLGDTGSMLIGFLVAAVAIESSVKQQTAFLLAVPLAICAIPILDAGAALVRRITTGQSVFTADRGHLHHALLLRGWSVNKTVIIISSLAALTCGGALASYFTNYDLIAVAVSLAVFLSLAAARVFGHAEARMVASRSKSVARKLLSRGVRRPVPETESAVQLQGRRKWQSLWTALREASPTYNVTGMTFQIAIPHLHESFYANWNCNDTETTGDTWRVTLPLLLEDRPIGKLSLVGATAGRQALADMQQLFDFLEYLHDDIARLAKGDVEVVAIPRQGVALVPALN